MSGQLSSDVALIGTAVVGLWVGILAEVVRYARDAHRQSAHALYRRLNR